MQVIHTESLYLLETKVIPVQKRAEVHCFNENLITTDYNQ